MSMTFLESFLQTSGVDDLVFVNKMDSDEINVIRDAITDFAKLTLDKVQHCLQGLTTIEEVDAVIERTKTQLK